MRICTLCSTEKPISDFYVSTYHNKGICYLRTKCKTCENKLKYPSTCKHCGLKELNSTIREYGYCAPCRDTLGLSKKAKASQKLNAKVFCRKCNGYLGIRRDLGQKKVCASCRVKSSARQNYFAATKEQKLKELHARGTKKCTSCKDYKPLDQFYKSNSNWSGYDPRCKSCDSQKQKDKGHEWHLQKKRRYREKNRAKYNSDRRLENMALTQARPKWVNRKAIYAIYEEARQRSLTGIKYSVDHIYPLTHGLVCGLHVPENLRVLELRANVLKNNNFVPIFTSSTP